MKNPHRYAIVRPPGTTYVECIQPPGSVDAIDYARALEQHGAYVAAIATQAVDVVALEPDEHFPDSCFVEDAVIVTEGLGVVCLMGASTRRGEEISVAGALAEHVELAHITPPATIDGGDVVRIQNRLYVGVSQRTNRHAIDQLRAILEPRGGDVVAVEMKGVLHLKSACTYVGSDTIVISPEHVDPRSFGDCHAIAVPAAESYAANCLAVGDAVLVSAGYPRTRDLLDTRGFDTQTLEMSEFRKGWGSLTCLSVLF